MLVFQNSNRLYYTIVTTGLIDYTIITTGLIEYLSTYLIERLINEKTFSKLIISSNIYTKLVKVKEFFKIIHTLSNTISKIIFIKNMIRCHRCKEKVLT